MILTVELLWILVPEILFHTYITMGLSRVTAIEGLYISDLCESKIAVNPDGEIKNNCKT